LFAVSDSDYGRTSVVKHKIATGSAPLYPFSKMFRLLLLKYLFHMLAYSLNHLLLLLLIVDKCCDAWNDILKKDNFVKKLCSREWIELV
jgi:hypothetical protein